MRKKYVPFTQPTSRPRLVLQGRLCFFLLTFLYSSQSKSTASHHVVSSHPYPNHRRRRRRRQRHLSCLRWPMYLLEQYCFLLRSTTCCYYCSVPACTRPNKTCSEDQTPSQSSQAEASPACSWAICCSCSSPTSTQTQRASPQESCPARRSWCGWPVYYCISAP